MILPSQTFSVMFPQFFKRIHSQSFLFLCHHVSRKSGLNRNLSNLEFSNVGAYIGFNSSGALSSSEIPTGCPNKNSKYKRKIECARGWGGEDDWEEGKGPLFSLFPSHRAPGCFPFLSFQPPCDTKRQISRGETLYGARTFQYEPTSISSPHQAGIKLNFKRRRVEKSDFYLAENIQLILQNKNDTSRLDFSHDYKYLQKP